MAEFDYDVALSFAGEDRHYVDPIATLLKRRQVNIFYDAFEQGAMWGKDLYQHFSKVYFERSRFFIPFLSQNYAAKKWTTHELRNAQARAFQETKQEYILPIRLDDTEIPGILPTIGHLNYHSYTPEQIVDLILEKLDRLEGGLPQPNRKAANVFKGSIPKLRKEFTQREKDLFAQQSFAFIMQYFQDGLKALEQSDSDIATEFNLVHRFKFVCSVYVKGDVGNRCKIWLGGGWSRDTDQVSFYSAKQIDINQDNSITESLSVSDDGHQLRLERGQYAYLGRGEKDYDGTQQAAAEHLWQRLIEPLKHDPQRGY
jgi:hypothetical protein